MATLTAPAAQPTSGQQPSLNLFFETLSAHHRTEALKAAIELNLFTAIGEGNHSADAIATRIGGLVRATRMLCDFLVVIGFLTKSSKGYELTADSAMFLDRRSPTYTGDAVRFLGSSMLTEPFKNLAGIVRNGRNAIDSTVAPEHPVWMDFARAMAPVVGLPAQLLAQQVDNSKQFDGDDDQVRRLTTTNFDGFQTFAGVGKNLEATCLIDDDGQRLAKQLMGDHEEHSGRCGAGSSPAV